MTSDYHPFCFLAQQVKQGCSDTSVNLPSYFCTLQISQGFNSTTNEQRGMLLKGTQGTIRAHQAPGVDHLTGPPIKAKIFDPKYALPNA